MQRHRPSDLAELLDDGCAHKLGFSSFTIDDIYVGVPRNQHQEAGRDV